MIGRAVVVIASLAASAAADPPDAPAPPVSAPLAPDPVVAPWHRELSRSASRFDLMVGGTPLGIAQDGDAVSYLALLRVGPAYLRRTARGHVAIAQLSYEVSTAAWWTIGLRGLFEWRQVWGAALAAEVNADGLGASAAACWRTLCLEARDRVIGADRDRTLALTVTIGLRKLLEPPNPDWSSR